MALKAKTKNNTNKNQEDALKEIKSEKMVPITFKVPLSLRQAAKIKAVQNRTTITDVLTEYLNKFVGNK